MDLPFFLEGATVSRHAADLKCLVGRIYSMG